MLTITSNFCNFKDRQGEYYTRDDLELLSKNVIICDIINFKNNGKTGYGFTANIAKQVMTKVTAPKDGKIIVINDLSLHMLNELLDAGYKLENIYMAYGKWNKKAEPDDNEIAYNIMVEYIKANFKEKINIIKLKEIFNMKGTKIDLIIANPPYGSIGAKITDHIRQQLNYCEYINLEPIVDYLRIPNTINYLKLTDIELVEGFDGAHVLPSIANISNIKTNNLTVDDFYLFTISNNYTAKYFKENMLSNLKIEMSEDTTKTDLDFSTRLIFGVKICANAFNHSDKLGLNVVGTKKSTPFKLNNKTLTLKDYYDTKNSKAFWGVILNFKTSKERLNAFNFAYSDSGAKFLNALAFSFKRDNYHMKEYNILFPRVDWTRSWTVEEILENYGYTKDEIINFIKDLDNFNGIK